MSWQMDQILKLFQTNDHIIGLPVEKIYIRGEGGPENESCSLVHYGVSRPSHFGEGCRFPIILLPFYFTALTLFVAFVMNFMITHYIIAYKNTEKKNAHRFQIWNGTFIFVLVYMGRRSVVKQICLDLLISKHPYFCVYIKWSNNTWMCGTEMRKWRHIRDRSLFMTRGGAGSNDFLRKMFSRPTRRAKKEIRGLLDSACNFFDAYSYR